MATLGGSVGREGAVAPGATRLDPLLDEKEAGKDLVCQHGCQVAPLVDALD